MEESVYNENFHRRGEFLIGNQELHYSYDIDQPRGQRIVKLEFNNKNILENPQQTFKIAINSFIANANTCEGKPNIFANKLQQQQGKFKEYTDVLDRHAVFNYMEQIKPELNGKLDGRIKFCGKSLLDQHAAKGTRDEDKYISCINTLKYDAIQKKTKNAEPTPSLENEFNEPIPGPAQYAP